jgi:hypothetical protein
MRALSSMATHLRAISVGVTGELARAAPNYATAVLSRAE